MLFFILADGYNNQSERDFIVRHFYVGYPGTIYTLYFPNTPEVRTFLETHSVSHILNSGLGKPFREQKESCSKNSNHTISTPISKKISARVKKSFRTVLRFFCYHK